MDFKLGQPRADSLDRGVIVVPWPFVVAPELDSSWQRVLLEVRNPSQEQLFEGREWECVREFHEPVMELLISNATAPSFKVDPSRVSLSVRMSGMPLTLNVPTRPDSRNSSGIPVGGAGNPNFTNVTGLVSPPRQQAVIVTRDGWKVEGIIVQVDLRGILEDVVLDLEACNLDIPNAIHLRYEELDGYVEGRQLALGAIRG